jgi:protoporphyrinogen IX oxidase
MLLNFPVDDSRKVVVPCFSSLSRCLSVMTAIRLAGPGLVPGPFFLAVYYLAMSSSYLWVKALHIVFVTSWFAGLFYMPRLLVNLAMVPPSSHAERERLLLMARKLYRFSSLLMLPALGFGLVMWLGYGVGRGSGSGWMHAKLLLVLGVVGYHVTCRILLKTFEQMNNRRSHRWFRVFNEASVLLFTAIVVLVVVKPF